MWYFQSEFTPEEIQHHLATVNLEELVANPRQQQKRWQTTKNLLSAWTVLACLGTTVATIYFIFVPEDDEVDENGIAGGGSNWIHAMLRWYEAGLCLVGACLELGWGAVVRSCRFLSWAPSRCLFYFLIAVLTLTDESMLAWWLFVMMTGTAALHLFLGLCRVKHVDEGDSDQGSNTLSSHHRGGGSTESVLEMGVGVYGAAGPESCSSSEPEDPNAPSWIHQPTSLNELLKQPAPPLHQGKPPVAPGQSGEGSEQHSPTWVRPAEGSLYDDASEGQGDEDGENNPTWLDPGNDSSLGIFKDSQHQQAQVPANDHLPSWVMDDQEH